MTDRDSAVSVVVPAVILTTTVTARTPGPGMIDITGRATRFLEEARAGDGALLVFLRHTSASLTIQENADPDVQTDLMSALATVAPVEAGWMHKTEGPDDMPAHVKTMLTGVSLQVPVMNGRMLLGTWQAIYLIEHRARSHRREIVFQFCGTRDGT